MPLKNGTTKETIGGNIGELLHKFKKTGSIGTSAPKNMAKAKAQAAAIAFEKAGKSKKMSKPVKKAVKGFEKGGINPDGTYQRVEKRNMSIPDNIPEDTRKPLSKMPEKNAVLTTPGGKKMSAEMKGIMERASADRSKAMSSPGGKKMQAEMKDKMEGAAKKTGPEFRVKKRDDKKRLASALFY
jgi:hypothetical protein